MSAALSGSSASAAAAPAQASAAAAAAASPVPVEARPAKRKADANLQAAVSKHLRTMTTRNALPPAKMRGQQAAAAATAAASSSAAAAAAAGAGKIGVGQTKITSVQDDLQNAQRLLEVIKREATDRDGQIATLQADLSRMNKKHDAEATEKRAALRNLDCAEAGRQDYRKKAEKLQVERDRLKVERDRLQTQRDELHLKTEEMHKTIRDAEKEHKKDMEGAAETVRKLRVEKEQLQVERDMLRKTEIELLQEAEDEQQKYEDDICDFQADLERASQTIRVLRAQKEELQTSTQCIACMDAERSVFYLSCGHFLMCAACDERLEEFKKPCPNCRKKINGRLNVFK